MKSLTLLFGCIFLASSTQAQVIHSSEYEARVKNKKESSEGMVYAIPMLGNIKIKAASYEFKKAAMAFQVDLNPVKKDSVAYGVVDTVESVSLKSLKEEAESMTANNTIKMEE